MDLKYLTVEQIVFLHDEIVKKTGGSLGVRDWDMIHSAVCRPQASFAGKDLYRDIFSKAATLWQSLIKNHGFVDGNKRTASSTALLFLELNQIKLTINQKELVEFTLKSENKNLTVKQISTWLKQHFKKSP